MGQTKKRSYDRYTLAYKLQAVKLANHPDVMSKDIAESLGIHLVMLYRWQMEQRKGELRENRQGQSQAPLQSTCFYVDEDTWQIVVADNYNEDGELWRFPEGV